MKIGELFVDVIPQLATSDVNQAMAEAARSASGELSFTADVGQARSEVSRAVSDMSRNSVVEGRLDIDTSSATREVRNVADAADNVASSSSQAAGGIGDLAGAIELAGFPGLAGAMEVASVGIMGVTGAADLANLASEKLSISTLKSTAASAKDVVVKGLQTAATWTATTATSALGAAMTFAMGPIGLIIIGLTALVAGLVIAYKNSETFRNIVNGVWESVKATAMGVVDWFTGTAMPWLRDAWQSVGSFFQGVWNNVLKPVFEAIGTVISVVWNNVVKPIFGLWVAYIQGVLVPIIQFLWNNVVSPIFGWIGSLISGTWNNVIKPALSALWGFIRDTLIPIISSLWNNYISPIFGWIGSTIRDTWNNIIKPALERFGEVVTDLQGFFTNAKDKAQDFIDKVKGITVPQWIKDMADFIGGIASNLGKGASSVGSFFKGLFGDAPASFRGTNIGSGPGGGGHALSRVQSALPAGLRVTSTYRSPAMNAAVGGHRTSLHMDRANPAVDIAGPVRLMDQFAAQLRAMGGWRQLLWRVPGHYDHIHVAHQGGVVNSAWGTVPGLRHDERPVITQVGERILSRNQNRAYESGGNGAIERLVAMLERNANRSAPLIGQAVFRETVDAELTMQRLEHLARAGRVR